MQAHRCADGGFPCRPGLPGIVPGQQAAKHVHGMPVATCIRSKPIQKEDHMLRDIQELIIESLNLPDMTADDLDPDQPLFGGDGLGLDSIDALELGVALQEKYALSLKGRTEEVREHFATARSLASFVEQELAAR